MCDVVILLFYFVNLTEVKPISVRIHMQYQHRQLKIEGNKKKIASKIVKDSLRKQKLCNNPYCNNPHIYRRVIVSYRCRVFDRDSTNVQFVLACYQQYEHKQKK